MTYATNIRNMMPREKKDYAKWMRKNPTPPEKYMWTILRCRRIDGHKFRRQAPILGYIVDFYCAKKRLAIEVDGRTHLENTIKDKQRDLILYNSRNIRTIRITTNILYNDRDRVKFEIRKAIRIFDLHKTHLEQFIEYSIK